MSWYFGCRSICQRMKWKSPTTPINRHERRDDPNPFPMFPWPRGRNWVWAVSDELLLWWEKREAELSRNLRIARLRLPRRKHSKKQQDGYQNGRRDWTASPFPEGGNLGTSRARPDNMCRICGGTKPHGTDKCYRMIDGEKPPRETGLPVPQFRSRSLPSRIASEHFARRMRVGRTRRQ